MVSYLQLAHNQRHPVSGNPVAKVIHSFGRADKVDRAALARLVASISRFLTPAQAVTAASAGAGELGGGVEVLDSRRLGAAWTLDQLWERLGIGAAIRRVAVGRRLDGDAVERVVFALVAQRACEPGSKLAATGWVAQRVAIEGCAGFTEDAAYAAMNFLLDALDEIAAEVFSSVAHLLNLDLDIVFVDTTSTYWETETADDDIDLAEPVADDEASSPVEAGARRFGHSKDHRADLPQVVIAMAVTRDGVPVRCWTFPGNTADTAITRIVKDDLGGWGLRRLVWVADRGFASAANRAYLTRGGGHYIHAEKLRHTNTEAAAALARAGRYRTVADNLRVKEVAVAPGGDSRTSTSDPVSGSAIAQERRDSTGRGLGRAGRHDPDRGGGRRSCSDRDVGEWCGLWIGHTGGAQAVGGARHLGRIGPEPRCVSCGPGGVEQHGVDSPGVQRGQRLVEPGDSEALGMLLASIVREQRGRVGRGELGRHLPAAGQRLVEGAVVALHLGEQLDHAGWQVLAQELHGAHITADRHQARCSAVDQPGDGVGHLARIGLPAVLRTLLEPALRPAPGCGAGDVQLLPLDLGMLVGGVGEHCDQLGTEPVGDHHDMREQRLGGGQQWNQTGQRADVGGVGLGGLGQVRGIEQPVAARDGEQRLTRGVGTVDERIDSRQRGRRGAAVDQLGAQCLPPQRRPVRGLRQRCLGGQTDRHHRAGRGEHPGRYRQDRSRSVDHAW